VIVEVLNSDATKQRFATRGLSTGYEVAMSLDDPLISISTLSGSAPVAARTRDALVRRFTDELDRRQVAAGAPANEMITSSTVTSNGPLESTSGRTRVAAVMLLLGAALALGFPFLIDALRERRNKMQAPPPTPAKPSSRKQRADPDVREVATVASGNGNGNGNGNANGNGNGNGPAKTPARRAR
jgi:hypothetical protein